MFDAVATSVIALLGAGLLLRRFSAIHIPVMLAAFGLDAMLLLAAVVTRGAVRSGAAAAPALLAVHISITALALVFYAAMFLLGRRLYGGANSLRSWHRRAAGALGLCRAVSYATGWML